MQCLLLDTNVISELRKPDSLRDPAVSSWADDVDFSNTYISVISVYEIEVGIRQKERRDPKQGQLLRKWFEGNVLSTYHGRILDISAEVARKAAALQVPDPHQVPDAFIAATALCHKLTLATRNISDFLNTGTQLVNPWEPSVVYACLDVRGISEKL